jgi:hypothetical protein
MAAYSRTYKITGAQTCTLQINHALLWLLLN